MHSEFSRECRCKPLLSKLNEDFSIGLSNQHGRDTDASPRSIVTHNNLRDIFHTGVDYDKQACSSTLSVPHLVNKGAFSPTSDYNLGWERLLAALSYTLLNIVDN